LPDDSRYSSEMISHARYYSLIRDVSGFSEKENTSQHLGFYYGYATAPRALLFRREQAKVRDGGGIRRLMRHNNYEHDPESRDCPR